MIWVYAALAIPLGLLAGLFVLGFFWEPLERRWPRLFQTDHSVEYGGPWWY